MQDWLIIRLPQTSLAAGLLLWPERAPCHAQLRCPESRRGEHRMACVEVNPAVFSRLGTAERLGGTIATQRVADHRQ